MSRWDDLTMAQRSELINLYLRGGVLDLQRMRDHYNTYAEGGISDTERQVESELQTPSEDYKWHLRDVHTDEGRNKIYERQSNLHSVPSDATYISTLVSPDYTSSEITIPLKEVYSSMGYVQHPVTNRPIEPYQVDNNVYKTKEVNRYIDLIQDVFKGYNNAQIAAILANAHHETAGFRVFTQIGADNPAKGILQFEAGTQRKYDKWKSNYLNSLSKEQRESIKKKGQLGEHKLQLMFTRYLYDNMDNDNSELLTPHDRLVAVAKANNEPLDYAATKHFNTKRYKEGWVRQPTYRDYTFENAREDWLSDDYMRTTRAFMSSFERPGEPHLDNRLAHAQYYYNLLNELSDKYKHIPYSQEYLTLPDDTLLSPYIDPSQGLKSILEKSKAGLAY